VVQTISEKGAKMSEPAFQIITPPVADETDALDHGLVALTEAICQTTGEETGFGLGGRFGYGEDYENDVFMMRRYCWCESTSCKWCDDDACGCPNPEPRHYVDGIEKSCDDFWSANKKIVGEMPGDSAKFGTPEYEAADAAWSLRIAERDRRLKMIYPARIHSCEPRGMMADRLEGEDERPNQRAPNFWHKKSGMRVWWYKWIGRSMETVGDDGVNLQQMFDECLASLAASK
jgi:hypothetical protein